MTEIDPSQYYLINIGSTFRPLNWCWFARTKTCDDRDVTDVPPARDFGHSYRAGFETEDAAKAWGRKQGYPV